MTETLKQEWLLEQLKEAREGLGLVRCFFTDYEKDEVKAERHEDAIAAVQKMIKACEEHVSSTRAAPSVEGDALCVIERTLNGLLHTKLGADYRENVITSLEVLARLKQTKQQTDYLQSPESVSTKTGGKDNENNAIKSRPECMAAWPLVDKAMAKLGGV